MRLIDANLLVHAYNSGSPFHARAKVWLAEILSGLDPIGLSWTNILAFLRITTNPKIFGDPLTWEQATSKVDSWLRQPCVVVVEPGERYWGILQTMIERNRSPGPLTMDAHLAALAIERDAVLCTSDKDFNQFPGLKLEYPLGQP